MMRQVLRYGLYLLVSYAAVWGSERLGSDFLRDFLTRNLITLLVALIAINTATRTALLSKLKEFGQQRAVGFSHTSRQLRIALYEQFGLMAVAIVACILATSAAVAPYPLVLTGALVALGATFIGSLQIIFDTGQAVLILLEKEHEQEHEQEQERE
ncbi:MAG: hypothetical protein GAK35_03513 [Herbaspirillum frisingense]|uniref:DUF2721 domain-containing protein n=1 Tax=Herbaspirillum frisingense TaxID=92645 RepID=A0A7V8FU57_9BURK|nr:MAG: hypothetical protein GAK35_03513 [Herbaspirillum frisingense]